VAEPAGARWFAASAVLVSEAASKAGLSRRMFHILNRHGARDGVTIGAVYMSTLNKRAAAHPEDNKPIGWKIGRIRKCLGVDDLLPTAACDQASRLSSCNRARLTRIPTSRSAFDERAPCHPCRPEELDPGVEHRDIHHA